MLRHRRVLSVVLIVGIALLGGVTVLGAQTQPPAPIPLKQAQLFFEFNSSAEDLGIQAFIDGEGWKELTIFGPDGNRLLQVEPKGNTRTLGLTELFFESVEPPLAEFPSDSLFALFPEGKYRIVAQSVDGPRQEETKILTHDIPDAPVILSPPEGGLVNRNNTVISWAPVHTPAGIRIRTYQVIVESESHGRHLIVDLPARVTHLAVPPTFLNPGTEYICEVLAKEVSGNQTITECSFETM